MEQIYDAMAKTEEIAGKSSEIRKIRSSYPYAVVRASMPGMMDTILNLGLNDVAVEGMAKKSGNPRWAYDSYRRFIQMFSDVVMCIDKEKFEEQLQAAKDAKGVKMDTESWMRTI